MWAAPARHNSLEMGISAMVCPSKGDVTVSATADFDGALISANYGVPGLIPYHQQCRERRCHCLEDHLRTILLTPRRAVKVEIATEGDDGRLMLAAQERTYIG